MDVVTVIVTDIVPCIMVVTIMIIITMKDIILNHHSLMDIKVFDNFLDEDTFQEIESSIKKIKYWEVTYRLNPGVKRRTVSIPPYDY